MWPQLYFGFDDTGNAYRNTTLFGELILGPKGKVSGDAGHRLNKH